MQAETGSLDLTILLWTESPRQAAPHHTSSIVAVNPDTGKYVWHFQETPNDRWDFDSDQQIIAATIPVGGKPRRVLMHAPKNGFFYVLDAKTGQFCRARPSPPATGHRPSIR